jgi:predicted nucleotide-binding protein
MKRVPDFRTAVCCHCDRKADLSFSSSLVESVRTSAPDAAVTIFDFHNNDANKKFSKGDVHTLESDADVLSLALYMPHPELQLDKMNVFIVHGRDKSSVDGLELILRRYGVTPMILRHEKRSAQLILDSLRK